MKASAIEFRLRMLIQVIIVLIAMWAPWVRPWDLRLRISTLEWLALELSRTGLASFALSTHIVIIFGALLAGIGAVLRVWGVAYLGYDVVHQEKMLAAGVMSAGPYRFLRNPLYLGSGCMMAAIALLATPSGALFLLLMIAFFYLRLILGEEAFLTAKLGEPYRQYQHAVPPVLPRFRAALPHAAAQPRWLIALLTELMAIGTVVTMALVPWTYDNSVALLGILLSFAASLVVWGLMKEPIATSVSVITAATAWGFFHLSIARALLIGLGAWLVVRALTLRGHATRDLT